MNGKNNRIAAVHWAVGPCGGPLRQAASPVEMPVEMPIHVIARKIPKHLPCEERLTQLKMHLT